MDLKQHYNDRIPKKFLHYVEGKVFQFIDNDVSIASGFLAAAFHQFNEDGESAPIRMSFGHLSSMLLKGEGIEDRKSMPDFSQALPDIRKTTDDFKIMCLDHRYAEHLNAIANLFDEQCNPAGANAVIPQVYEDLDQEVLDQVDEILANSVQPGESKIEVRFLFQFVKLFGRKNLYINTNKAASNIPRIWGIGSHISRVTTGETGTCEEDHRARVNFGDRTGCKYAQKTFDILTSPQRRTTLATARK